jgi:hypothetical protein
MFIARVAVIALAALSLSGCGVLEPSAADLVRGASAKMQSTKSVHIDGTGSMGIRGGFSMSFDFKLVGDIELPDRSRMNLQMGLFGQSLDVEMLTVGGKAYAKDPVTGKWSESSTGKSSSSTPPFFITDPGSTLDLSKVAGVVEVDRPVVDGQKTRHLRYTPDPATLADSIRKSAGAAGASSLPMSDPTMVGEVWIRVDDGQIVRQLVKVTLEIDDLGASLFGALPGASTAPAPTTAAKGSFEMTFDFTFSRHGQPIPAITAPPTR